MQGTPPHLQSRSQSRSDLRPGSAAAGGMEIVDAQSLSERSFHGLVLDRPYLDLFGMMEPRFQVLIWGGEGSGKSTLAMGLARALLPFARDELGRVLYVSSEEGPHMTVSMRAERLGALHPDLLISDFDNISQLKDAIRDYDVEFLVVDSVTVVDPSRGEARDFLRWCRQRGVGVALVAQALKNGSSFKGNRRLGHDVEAVVHCYTDEAGVCHAETEKNRYRSHSAIEVPMSSQRVERVEGQAALDALRENPDCTITPQSAQCKAIFASLDESESKTAGSKKKRSKKKRSKKKRSKKKKKKSSKKSGGSKKKKKKQPSAAARRFDTTLSNLSSQLSDALA